MFSRPIIIGAIAVALVVAYLLWWPGLLQAVRGMHGAAGGGPAMHGGR